MKADKRVAAALAWRCGGSLAKDRCSAGDPGTPRRLFAEGAGRHSCRDGPFRSHISSK